MCMRRMQSSNMRKMYQLRRQDSGGRDAYEEKEVQKTAM